MFLIDFIFIIFFNDFITIYNILFNTSYSFCFIFPLTSIISIISSNKIIEENNENEINEEHEDEIDEDNKKKIVNLSTPKKSKNYLDKNEIYFYYDKNQSSTAAMTSKKERRKMMSTRTESKNKNIYTKLQMD